MARASADTSWDSASAAPGVAISSDRANALAVSDRTMEETQGKADIPAHRIGGLKISRMRELPACKCMPGSLSGRVAHRLSQISGAPREPQTCVNEREGVPRDPPRRPCARWT